MTAIERAPRLALGTVALLAALLLAWCLVRIAGLLLHPFRLPPLAPAAAAVAEPGGAWAWFRDSHPAGADAGSVDALAPLYPEADASGAMLVGVVVRGEDRLAVIAASDGKERVLRPGEQLGSLRVEAVDRHRALVSGGGRLQQLTLRRLGEANGTGTRPPGAPQAGLSTRPAVATWRTQLAERVVATTTGDGEVPALRLDGIAPGLLRLAGLEPGDRVIELDGEAIGVVLAEYDLGAELAAADRLALRVLRRGEMHDLTTSGEALRELLRAASPALATGDEE